MVKDNTTEKNSVLYKLRQQGDNANLRPRTQDAVNFFIKQIKRLRTNQRKSPGFANDNELISINKIQSGMLVYFGYEAETPYPQLPYYDKYPLTLIINRWVDENNGTAYFDGINLHYVPLGIRFKFMEKIIKQYGYWNMDNNVNKFSNFNNYYAIRDLLHSMGFGFAYKKYLLNNVTTQFSQVPFKYIDVALSLPLSQWSGASDASVWSDYITKSLQGKW